MNEKIIRRVEITIESHSQTIIKIRGGKTNFQFCRRCESETMVFTLASAARIFNLNVLFLEKLFQTDQIHYAADGVLCGNSLAGFSEREIRRVED